MDPTNLRCSVSEFIALTNQTLEYAYPSIEIEGEVASFKINQGKFVFFDLKDAESSLGCFMMVYQLRQPIEDGMKIIVTASPKLTKWGKFSLTVRALRPVGEGSLKKSFELLKSKLDNEGLFADERKRVLPEMPTHIAVISSIQAAGYADFIKIIGDRWGGMKIDVAHVQVQGTAAPDQIIRALKYLNQQEKLPEVIVLIRGGGSADDLSAFNDELLVREIAASRVPVLTGIGHDVDTSLSDMVADRAAATPSNAAQLLVPEREDVIHLIDSRISRLVPQIGRALDELREIMHRQLASMLDTIEERMERDVQTVASRRDMLKHIDPAAVLRRGYAIMRGAPTTGKKIMIETYRAIITAEVQNVENK